MAEITTLMTIGRFSSLSRLSVRMLRHYDAQGVLVPADIDPSSGYRRYAPHQLADAADIRNLRDVGFGVSAIGILLAARGTPAWTQALCVQRESLVAEQRAATGRVSLITRLLDHGAHLMPITLNRTTVPAMTVATLRGTVASYSDEGRLWGQLMPLLAARSITPIGPCGVIEHDDEYTEHDVDLSIFVPVVPGTSVEPPVDVLELPARDCLVARVVGPYDRISEAHDLIAAHLTTEGIAVRDDVSPAGRAFNLYVTTPDQVDEADLVTEVCVPLGRAG
ncbi:MerR family DNA-binding transcriptional regulator [Pseudoclavibacter chungangensis]|uniref:MerR family DNA-binding transcriptional regulator n=1 Tax=Pseudoclavibacter chungangensis TaxID=587635 RepID=A0A7J5C0A0_9MICO|nr:MerR family transcriptional regulator [Pseudoclavibacter chungangensis]KAB1660311.1 MerR family DNA-binding transcriptional regulator [Pseudoclavibacter chungangensis]NYJ65663.1 DNA-binding transcriptional MerR regulator/effector-binding domain-containing protein [Pseudoclavibacter chungangensis]